MPRPADPLCRTAGILAPANALEYRSSSGRFNATRSYLRDTGHGLMAKNGKRPPSRLFRVKFLRF